jgi:CheY-like chemotaxis protein
MANILLIDDDRSITNLLKTLLELESDEFNVQVVAMGEEAWQQLQQHQPDLIMVDYHLKDMNGVELVKRIRQTPQLAHLPVVMASGMDMSAEAKAAGVNLFLLKPFEPGDIPNLFWELIGR